MYDVKLRGGLYAVRKFPIACQGCMLLISFCYSDIFETNKIVKWNNFEYSQVTLNRKNSMLPNCSF